MAGVQRRGSPIAPRIVAVHDHLRLVLRLRAGESRIHVQIFRPSVICANFKAPAEAVGEVGLQRVVAAVALGVPEEAGAQIGIGTRGPRGCIRRPGPRGPGRRSSCPRTPPAGIRLPRRRSARRYRWGRCSAGRGIQTSHVGHAQSGGGGELPLHGKVPLLHGGSLGIGLHSLGRVGSAGCGNSGPQEGGTARIGVDRRNRKQRAGSRESDPLYGRQRIEQEAEIVDQRIVRSESRADRRFAVAEGIPGESDSGAEQPVGIVFGEHRFAHQRSGLEDAGGIGDVIGGTPERLVPAGGELLPDARAKVRLRRSLMVSCRYHAPNRLRNPTSLAWGTTWKLLTVPCRNVVRLVKVAWPKLARSGILIVLDALKPDAGADLVDAAGDLQIVGIGEKIAAIPCSGGVVRAGRCDAGVPVVVTPPLTMMPPGPAP